MDQPSAPSPPPQIIFKGENAGGEIIIAPEKAKSHKKKIRTEVVPPAKKPANKKPELNMRLTDGTLVESILSKVR